MSDGFVGVLVRKLVEFFRTFRCRRWNGEFPFPVQTRRIVCTWKAKWPFEYGEFYAWRMARRWMLPKETWVLPTDVRFGVKIPTYMVGQAAARYRSYVVFLMYKNQAIHISLVCRTGNSCLFLSAVSNAVRGNRHRRADPHITRAHADRSRISIYDCERRHAEKLHRPG